jgi:hypothetical protein
MAMGSSSVRGMSAAERLDMVPVLAGRELDIEPIPGGLTNANYKVNTGGHTYFARLSDPSTALLAIDRAAEHHNSVAAASTGVAPAVVDFTPKVGVLVIEWITGRTLEPADLRQERTIRAVADACRRCTPGRGSPPTSTCLRYSANTSAPRWTPVSGYLIATSNSCCSWTTSVRCCAGTHRSRCPATTTCSPRISSRKVTACG